jgi:glutamine amidotransferase
MQLLFESSEEDNAKMLGIIPARLKRLAGHGGLRVPHMGWNTIRPGVEDRLLSGIGGEWFYFVHSFAAPVGDWTLATGFHGETFSAVVRQNNFYGAQFHPERSAAAGASLLENFMEISTP